MPLEVIRRYDDAIHRPDGPAHCARRTPANLIDPTRGLDWGTVGDTVDLEVCVFFVAAELQDIDRIPGFLTASGFRGIHRLRQDPAVARSRNIEGHGVLLNGGMPIAAVPNGFGGFGGKLFAYSLTVGLQMDETGRPYHVIANFNYL